MRSGEDDAVRLTARPRADAVRRASVVLQVLAWPLRVHWGRQGVLFTGNWTSPTRRLWRRTNLCLVSRSLARLFCACPSGTPRHSSARGQLYLLWRSRGWRGLRGAPVLSKPVAYATETRDDATGCRSRAGPLHYGVEVRRVRKYKSASSCPRVAVARFIQLKITSRNKNREENLLRETNLKRKKIFKISQCIRQKSKKKKKSSTSFFFYNLGLTAALWKPN